MTITAPIRRIVGPTILLGSGTYFDFENPEGSSLTIEDVAYSLAFQSRFTGQCVSRRTGRRVYYPIAQHCVLMAGYADPPHKLAALMHEVGEATCGDLNAPLKAMCPDYKRVEKHCEIAGLAHFGVAVPDPAYIKLLDMRMLATERRDLMPWNGEEWTGTAEPFDAEIVPWEDPHGAAQAFLSCWRTLTKTEPAIDAPRCFICAEPMKAGDVCAMDINEGACHAECLEGSPIVDLETGEPSPGPLSTFIYRED